MTDILPIRSGVLCWWCASTLSATELAYIKSNSVSQLCDILEQGISNLRSKWTNGLGEVLPDLPASGTMSPMYMEAVIAELEGRQSEFDKQ